MKSWSWPTNDSTPVTKNVPKSAIYCLPAAISHPSAPFSKHTAGQKMRPWPAQKPTVSPRNKPNRQPIHVDDSPLVKKKLL